MKKIDSLLSLNYIVAIDQELNVAGVINYLLLITDVHKMQLLFADSYELYCGEIYIMSSRKLAEFGEYTLCQTQPGAQIGSLMRRSICRFIHDEEYSCVKGT